MYHPNVGMKSTQANDALDRGVASDLWRNTLSQIPSVLGRLVYLASLRNSNSGRYEHHGLALVFGEDEANRALKRSHSQVFREWLTFNLEQQKTDLELYLSGLDEDKRTVLATWQELAYYRALMPASLRTVEKQLYIADLKAVLELMGNAAGGPDPNA